MLQSGIFEHRTTGQHKPNTKYTKIHNFEKKIEREKSKYDKVVREWTDML